MNKYHEALDCAITAIQCEVLHFQKRPNVYKESIEYRLGCIEHLKELKAKLSEIAQLKQSLKELDLEESK